MGGINDSPASHTEALKVGIIGAGRMGLSHLSILGPHPDVRIVGLCDASRYLLDVLEKYTGLAGYPNADALIESTTPDAVVIATPSKSHAEVASLALENGIDVFLEKPLALSPIDGRHLVELAKQTRRVTQLGYHFRFIASFREVKRLLEHEVIGDVHNFRVSASGPAVLQPTGGTWRSKRDEGGGCLYDYASHGANLMLLLFGMPSAVGGAVVGRVFSEDVDDEVYATFYFSHGLTGHLGANWSDSAQRKMSMKVEVWGTKGKITADRQECQVYLSTGDASELGLREGWNVRYTTELTPPVRYYVRGEEYSAQLDYFVDAVRARRLDNVNSFASGYDTDLILDAIRRDAVGGGRTAIDTELPLVGASEPRRGIIRKRPSRAL